MALDPTGAVARHPRVIARRGGRGRARPPGLVDRLIYALFAASQPVESPTILRRGVVVEPQPAVAIVLPSTNPHQSVEFSAEPFAARGLIPARSTASRQPQWPSSPPVNWRCLAAELLVGGSGAGMPRTARHPAVPPETACATGTASCRPHRPSSEVGGPQPTRFRPHR